MEISIRILTWAPRLAPFDTFNVPFLYCLLFSYRNPYSKAINYSRLTPRKIFRTEREGTFIYSYFTARDRFGGLGGRLWGGWRSSTHENRLIWQQTTADRRGWSDGLKALDMQLSGKFSQHLDIIYCSHRNQYSSGRRTMSYDTEILNFRLWASFVSWMPTHSTSFITLLKLFPLRTFIYILNIALIVSRIDVFYFTSSSFLFLHCAEIFFLREKNELLNFPQVNFRGKFAARS